MLGFGLNIVLDAGNGILCIKDRLLILYCTELYLSKLLPLTEH